MIDYQFIAMVGVIVVLIAFCGILGQQALSYRKSFKVAEQIVSNDTYDLALSLDDTRRINELAARFQLSPSGALRLSLRLAHGRHVADRRHVPSPTDDLYATVSRQLECERPVWQSFELLASDDFRADA